LGNRETGQLGQIRRRSVPYSVTFDSSHGVVLLTYADALDETLVEQGAVLALTAALEKGCDRFLVDPRRITKPLSARELVRIARGLEDLGVQPGQRIAMLTSPFETEDAIFGTIAQGAGHSVQFFSNKRDALAWLESERADRQPMIRSPSDPSPQRA
jgi:hypothetical protein